MTAIPRKSDGRRIFTARFKRVQLERVLRGELTLAALGRKLKIAPSLLQRWRRQLSQTDGAAAETLRPASPQRTLRADQYIRELQLLVGKQTVELELLRAEMDALKMRRGSRRESG